MAKRRPTTKHGEEKHWEPIKALPRWRAIVDTWDALDYGLQMNEGELNSAGMISLQTDGARAIAERLGVPYLAVLLLDGQISVADLAGWAAWPESERAALLAAAIERG
jgi:hypothetical protein